MLRVLSVLFGIAALRIFVAVTRKLDAFFAGAFAPHTVRTGVILTAEILFSLAFLYAATLLFRYRTAGIRWGFFCLGLEASLWVTGNFNMAEVIWVIAAAGALWWCMEQIGNQSAERDAKPAL